MNNVTILKENDVYRIGYIKPTEYSNHCFEGLAVVRLGGYPVEELMLVDNFWTTRGNKVFSVKDIGTTITATFYFNLDDVISIKEYDRKYYKKGDVVHLSRQHGCVADCIDFYVPKGTKRNREVMLEYLNQQIHKHKHEISYAESSIIRDEEKVLKVKAATAEELEKMYI